MKKKLLALVTTVLMLFSFVGCSTEGTALIKEMEKVNAWEAAEETGTMSVDLSFGETTGKMTLDYSAYTSNKDLKLDMTITPKSLEMNGATLDLTKGTYKLSPVKVYMDGVKMYMSSSYIKELLAIAGVETVDSIDLSKDYIALDLTDMCSQMGVDVKELIEEKQSVAEQYAEFDDIKLPIKQEGRKYTIELSADEMITAGLNMYVKSIESQKDVLTAEYKALGLSDAEIKEVMAQLSELSNDETVKELKEVLKGSTVKTVLSYEDDKQTTEISCGINVTVEDQKFVANFSMKDIAKKAAKKEIKMPTSVTTYTMNDLMSAAIASEVEETPAATDTTDATDATAETATTASTNKAA